MNEIDFIKNEIYHVDIYDIKIERSGGRVFIKIYEPPAQPGDIFATSIILKDDDLQGNLKMKLQEMFPSKYLAAIDIKKPTTVTIRRVDTTSVKDRKGQDEVKFTVHFNEKISGHNKPLIMNKTNATSIFAVTMTDDTDNWPGKKVTLVTQMITAFGKTAPAIRISDTIATSSKNWHSELHKLGKQFYQEQWLTVAKKLCNDNGVESWLDLSEDVVIKEAESLKGAIKNSLVTDEEIAF